MAVSKIAVMALVGILAVPILLGYALNLSEVTETDYKPDGESINVTPLLQTSSVYSYTHADPYKLNTDIGYMEPTGKTFPYYQTRTANVSSLYYASNAGAANTLPTLDLVQFKLFSLFVTGTDGTNYAILDINGSSIHFTINQFKTLYYNGSTKELTVTATLYSHTYDLSDQTSIVMSFTYVGNLTGQYSMYWDWVDPTIRDGWWVDLSGGFRFPSTGADKWYVNMPSYSKNILFSINLDSISDPNYAIDFNIGPWNNATYRLSKTTINDNIKWQVLKTNSNEVIMDDLYYDTSRSDNTYQVYVDMINNGRVGETQYTSFTERIQFRYVGSWPSIIGVANYFQSYTYDYRFSTNENPDNLNLDRILFDTSNTGVLYSPIIRVDDAYFRAFQYSVIENKTYAPSDFKTNPTTTITNVKQFGSEIVFAANSYTVDSAGNITLGTHKVSVNGLKLESIPVPVGYENRINGNVVSVTAQPSTISFNGQWVASISTIGNTATTYTKTEWNAGSFAWDGIDQNFLMVGLITCLGVFIALGIYLRKTGKGLMPLLIVCGCAAGLFFCMI